MGLSYGRKIPSGLVLSVDAANDKCQRQNIFQQYGTPSTSNQNVGFRINGTGTFQRVGYGQTIGGYTIQPNDVVYSYALGATGCHYHGDDIWITQGYYTFTFDYLVTGAANFPTTNYLANLERSVGGSAACPNSTQDVWQTIRFGGYYSGTGTWCRPLLYPGACGSSYLASSGTLYYKNPELTFSSSSTLGANDSQTTNRNFSAINSSDRSQIYDLVSPTGEVFVGEGDNGRPPPSPQGGGSWYFDGTTSTGYWQQSGALDHLNNQNYTMEVWVKTNATSQNGFWFEKGSVNTQYSLFQEGGNIVHRTHFSNLGTYDSLYTTTSTYMNTSNWYHVVATYDGTTKRTYINGNQVSSKNISGTVSTNTNGAWIGKYGGAGGYQYNGYLAKCNVYNRALSAAEIATNFNIDKARFGY